MNAPKQNPTTLAAAETAYTLIKRMRNPYWMAPMSGITDLCYRHLMDEMGAGVLISELVSAKGLVYSSERTAKMIRVHENPGTLVGIQLFGEDADDYVRVAPQVKDQGADFIDINLGCPVKKVVKKGCGSALMRDPEKLFVFLQHIRTNIDLPLTVKMRTGWSHEELTIHECVDAAKQAGCQWVAIHGRTRQQGYSGQADWELIADVKRNTGIPIIGNGDIRSADRARQLLEESGVDAVMIGRGALRDPWIFKECTGELGDTLSPTPIELLHRFHEMLEPVYDMRRTLLYLRKLAVWMAYGYPGAAAFRGMMFSLPTVRQVLTEGEIFFRKVAHLPRPKFDEAEAFMMGGHG
ncbi:MULTISPECIES: tRNA dihydrouridine synthase [unclassified Nitrospina]|uniref:tRNA dihydrouridine synthase n=1 Tax=unclassified Nitrospina TaxID=2638683 RepID=UPI003F9810DC